MVRAHMRPNHVIISEEVRSQLSIAEKSRHVQQELAVQPPETALLSQREMDSPEELRLPI